ncbi:hypothetical protein [Brochothrix campestris]|uniref:Uncharacterized protein n=1 Tax=Brochothrix campestris FSL F6-1037 TaxID=1265861 RepID=W7DA20_9LIST|nr:hypothetical protein [Brochothrix campestris]EUJ42113.1 hypothetical protein BCAMP_00745 [Brochothrix campestris FSL F6-1037]
MESVELQTVSMRDRLLIAVLLQEANVGLGAVIPAYSTYEKTATETNTERLSDLFNKQLITVASCSQLEAFTKDEDKDSYSFLLAEVHYEINITAKKMKEWEVHKYLCRPKITCV